MGSSSAPSSGQSFGHKNYDLVPKLNMIFFLQKYTSYFACDCTITWPGVPPDPGQHRGAGGGQGQHQPAGHFSLTV